MLDLLLADLASRWERSVQRASAPGSKPRDHAADSGSLMV